MPAPIRDLTLQGGDPRALVTALLPGDRRVLLIGESGVGKTTLAAGLAAALSSSGRRVHYLGADPGSPSLGVPGTLCLGTWRQGAWLLERLEALCSLDAARFRLPLVTAVETLARQVETGTLLVDAAGVVRGVAGAELLEALVRAARIDLVLALQRNGQGPPLAHELGALDAQVVSVAASSRARRLGKAAKARHRTRLWDAWLADGNTHNVALAALDLLGTPPRRAPEAWRGKLVAFLEQGRTRTLGEVVALATDTLQIRLPRDAQPTETLLVRDACRGPDGLIGTGRPFGADLVHYIPPPDLLPDLALDTPVGWRPVVQLGATVASLVNGVLGDPLLHLRLPQQRRSLLLDLGDGFRLPARIAHQVSDVFISHAHADHIGGFLWLLRQRIGEREICRLYGPPGLARHIEGFLTGFRWDRIGSRGPVFDVVEVDDRELRRCRLQAGLGRITDLGVQQLDGGVLVSEPSFQVRCTTLDHGIPVLAFAYEPAPRIRVRPQQLAAHRLAPGSWLTTLKQRILEGDLDTTVLLPDGACARVAELAADLTVAVHDPSLVYATDFTDTAENRQRLTDLAAGAHALFCEASFLERDRDQALRTGHFTARGCGEIAAAAGVRYLIPFHFSRRYEQETWRAYSEIAAVCPQVVLPRQVAPEGFAW